MTTIGHAFFSPYRLDGDICTYYQQVKPTEGRVLITDAPGLGIEADIKAMDKYRVSRVSVE